MRNFSFILPLSVMLLVSQLYACTGGKTAGDNAANTSDSTTTEAAAETDWEDVSEKEAIAFVEEFYSHATEDEGIYNWDEAVLQKYLSPTVLNTLHALVGDASTESDSTEKYATWLLTGLDNSEQIIVRNQDEANIAEDGRLHKTFTLAYWADRGLISYQELFYTVKKKGERLFITQIDSLNENAANQVWNMLEDRDRLREADLEDEEIDNYEEAELDTD